MLGHLWICYGSWLVAISSEGTHLLFAEDGLKDTRPVSMALNRQGKVHLVTS